MAIKIRLHNCYDKFIMDIDSLTSVIQSYYIVYDNKSEINFDYAWNFKLEFDFNIRLTINIDKSDLKDLSTYLKMMAFVCAVVKKGYDCKLKLINKTTFCMATHRYDFAIKPYQRKYWEEVFNSVILIHKLIGKK